MELNDLRKEIDAIDEELITLFCKRMDVAVRIAEYKKEKGLPVLDASREAIKLDDVAEKAGPEMADYVRQLYVHLFKLSRDCQENHMNG